MDGTCNLRYCKAFAHRTMPDYMSLAERIQKHGIGHYFSAAYTSQCGQMDWLRGITTIC